MRSMMDQFIEFLFAKIGVFTYLLGFIFFCFFIGLGAWFNSKIIKNQKDMLK